MLSFWTTLLQWTTGWNKQKKKRIKNEREAEFPFSGVSHSSKLLTAPIYISHTADYYWRPYYTMLIIKNQSRLINWQLTRAQNYCGSDRHKKNISSLFFIVRYWLVASPQPKKFACWVPISHCVCMYGCYSRLKKKLDCDPFVSSMSNVHFFLSHCCLLSPSVIISFILAIVVQELLCYCTSQ